MLQYTYSVKTLGGSGSIKEGNLLRVEIEEKKRKRKNGVFEGARLGPGLVPGGACPVSAGFSLPAADGEDRHEQAGPV